MRLSPNWRCSVVFCCWIANVIGVLAKSDTIRAHVSGNQILNADSTIVRVMQYNNGLSLQRLKMKQDVTLAKSSVLITDVSHKTKDYSNLRCTVEDSLRLTCNDGTDMQPIYCLPNVFIWASTWRDIVGIEVGIAVGKKCCTSSERFAMDTISQIIYPLKHLLYDEEDVGELLKSIANYMNATISINSTKSCPMDHHSNAAKGNKHPSKREQVECLPDDPRPMCHPRATTPAPKAFWKRLGRVSGYSSLQDPHCGPSGKKVISGMTTRLQLDSLEGVAKISAVKRPEMIAIGPNDIAITATDSTGSRTQQRFVRESDAYVSDSGEAFNLYYASQHLLIRVVQNRGSNTEIVYITKAAKCCTAQEFKIIEDVLKMFCLLHVTAVRDTSIHHTRVTISRSITRKWARDIGRSFSISDFQRSCGEHQRPPQPSKPRPSHKLPEELGESVTGSTTRLSLRRGRYSPMIEISSYPEAIEFKSGQAAVLTGGARRRVAMYKMANSGVFVNEAGDSFTVFFLSPNLLIRFGASQGSGESSMRITKGADCCNANELETIATVLKNFCLTSLSVNAQKDTEHVDVSFPSGMPQRWARTIGANFDEEEFRKVCQDGSGISTTPQDPNLHTPDPLFPTLFDPAISIFDTKSTSKKPAPVVPPHSSLNPAADVPLHLPYNPAADVPSHSSYNPAANLPSHTSYNPAAEAPLHTAPYSPLAEFFPYFKPHRKGPHLKKRQDIDQQSAGVALNKQMPRDVLEGNTTTLILDKRSTEPSFSTSMDEEAIKFSPSQITVWSPEDKSNSSTFSMTEKNEFSSDNGNNFRMVYFSPNLFIRVLRHPEEHVEVIKITKGAECCNEEETEAIADSLRTFCLNAVNRVRGRKREYFFQPGVSQRWAQEIGKNFNVEELKKYCRADRQEEGPMESLVKSQA